MKRRGHRFLYWLALMLGGATMFQAVGFTQSGVGGGCQRFMTNGITGSIDFSYLLDFENGFAGGLVDPCDDPSSPSMFMDCQGMEDTETGTQ